MGSPVLPHSFTEQGNVEYSQKAVETHKTVLNHLATQQLRLDPKAAIKNCKKCCYSDVLFVQPRSMAGIGLLNNFDFWRLFHVTRARAEFIIKRVKEAAIRIETEPCALTNDVPIHKNVLLCLWYLTNSDCSTAEAVKLFEIPSESIVNAALERGFRLISSLKDAVVKWPSQGLYVAVTRDIEQKYQIVNCVGCVGHEIFTAKNGDKTLLQVICNKVYKFAAVHVTCDIKMPLQDLFSSDLKSNLLTIPTDYFILANEEYGNYFHQGLLNSTYKIRTTLKEIKGNNEKLLKQMNTRLERTINMVNLTITETVERFPRLINLPKSMPEVIISAVVLQNFCSNDLPPFKFVV